MSRLVERLAARSEFRRGASMLFVLEAEAPLGHLLGYRAHLHARFDGAIDVNPWLSRYCPIADGGPSAA
jgi:hypothetical protein